MTFCEGGHFTIVPNVMKKIFGKDFGTRLYGILFIYTSLCSILMIVLQTEFLSDDPKSYDYFFYMNGGFSAISLILLVLFFNEDKYFKNQEY